MKWPALALTLLSAFAPTVAISRSPRPHFRTVAFKIDQLFGSRPTVSASINGVTYGLALHANAGFYLQINHAEAARTGVTNLQHRGAYGISTIGTVSDLGRDDGDVGPLKIGQWVARSVKATIFETPKGSAQGMLGLPFLYENHAILDFPRHKLTLSDAELPKSVALKMAEGGYSAHVMTRDPTDGRYTINVMINGVVAPMIVGTVASVNIDRAYAARAHVAIGAASGSYGGPSGAVEKVYETAKPVALKIDGWATVLTKATIEDMYAYSKTPRPINTMAARGGVLGADFMIANKAVIDFGNAILYLKQR